MALQDTTKNMSNYQYEAVHTKYNIYSNDLIDVKKTTDMWRKSMNRTIYKKVVNPVQSNLSLSRDINHSRDVHLWLQKVKLEKLKKITRVLIRMMPSNIKHTHFIRIIYKFL